MLTSNLKGKIEKAVFPNFGYNIETFNTWFANKRNLIIKEAGIEGYKKYLRCIFKMHRTAKDAEFLVIINKKFCHWMLIKLEDSFNHLDLLEYGLKMYNNRISCRE
eukprot:10610499-Ditylum_brightwellii.AAC.1